MRKKIDNSFSQKLKDKKTSDKGKQRNKLPLPLLNLLFHKLSSSFLQCNLLYLDIYKQHFQEL